jgi:ornithine cyclodeaminase
VFTFEVIAGAAVRQQLDENRGEVVDMVQSAYQHHQAGETINPDSYFLRFPEKPDSRIIALPALLRGDVQLAGIKWIASFPKNVAAGRPRASAVLILNDYETGYPIACLEAANISAARTAASAAVAARALRPGGLVGGRVAVVGGGVIARNICEYLHVVGCRPDTYVVHDIHEASGESLVAHLQSQGRAAKFSPALDEALDADIVVFATTALEPYVTRQFRPGQLVLNVSLRDLAPETVLGAHNILDDVDHCLKANTSPHLAEQLTGNRDFVTGTLADVLNGDVTVDDSKPVIFSPFGLGVLDIAVGAYVLDRARAAGQATDIPGFFGETSRW